MVRTNLAQDFILFRLGVGHDAMLVNECALMV